MLDKAKENYVARYCEWSALLQSQTSMADVPLIMKLAEAAIRYRKARNWYLLQLGFDR